ncbi:TATA box-binding protein-associated factor RNA polymerase I subunit A-like isoform X2 [Dysidea avara]|uniref:TATA box-binding protein-associated factor RNA polymerase I subunit A-like isoform X2 n=1 Tax=Dysidea avara TaxID=196820 RepID=UPI003327A8FE
MTPVRKYKRQYNYKSRPHEINETKDGVPVATFQLHHVQQLLLLLKHHLFQHNFVPAGEIMQTLVHASDIVPDTCRNFGLAILQQGTSTYTECLQYYKQQLSKKNSKHREEILLEMTFYMIQSGHLQDAQETIRSYLQVDPFKSNSLLQGYAGLYCYTLWKEKCEHAAVVTTSQNVNQPAVDLYAREALSHWRTLVGKPGCWDVFVVRHAEIHVHFDEVDEALDVLRQYQQNNPTSINAYRYLIEHNEVHQKDPTLAEQLLRELTNIDPSCPEVLQLAEILLQKDLPNYSEIQEILSRFLEYPHNSDEAKALKLLTTVLKNT